MPPSCHPRIDVIEWESLVGLSHHPVEERTNTEKRITKKHAMLQHQKDQMLIEIKGYAKPAYTIITSNLVYLILNLNISYPKFN
jgi:hypothetical protein